MTDFNIPDFDPVHTENYYSDSSGGFISGDTGEKLLQTNNDLYRRMKGDWNMTMHSDNRNMSWKMGREDGKLYVQRRQNNVREIAAWCQEYRRSAEQGNHDLLAPLGPDGNLQFMWVNLPKVISRKISDDYFDGMDWKWVKQDRTLKAQWYMVIQKEYPQFICYPGGRLPIPVEARYPSKRSGEKTLFASR